MDGLQTAAAGLLGAPVASVAVVGGASEAWGQLPRCCPARGEVVLVPSDFPQRDLSVAGRPGPVGHAHPLGS